MTRGQAIKKLRREGYQATVGRVRQAVLNGHIEPLPQKGSRGSFDFQLEHLQMLRRYFVEIRPGPQPLFAEKFSIRGAHDRLHRLARKKQRLRERGPSATVLRRQRRREADAVIQWLEQVARELAS